MTPDEIQQKLERFLVRTVCALSIVTIVLAAGAIVATSSGSGRVFELHTVMLKEERFDAHCRRERRVLAPAIARLKDENTQVRGRAAEVIYARARKASGCFRALSLWDHEFRCDSDACTTTAAADLLES